MRPLFVETLDVMTVAFRQIEKAVPPPKLVPAHGDVAFRYEEQMLEQALVQKLARVISGLGASIILLDHGYTQELFALQRIIDEFNEDILFLCIPFFGQSPSPLHDEYLSYFYEEEINVDGDVGASPQRRGMVSRKKIRAAIANWPLAPTNPSDAIEAHRKLHKAYSGFVHGASPQIMDLVGGNPPKFHLRGMMNTPRIPEAESDLWNYFYRSIHTLMFISLSFKLKLLTDQMTKFLAYFEEQTQGIQLSRTRHSDYPARSAS